MHTDHTQVANYIWVAKASDRISETTGYTFENRPLQLLTISSQNLANLDEILKDMLPLLMLMLIIVIYQTYQ
jgi:hypothetical protein